MPTPHERLPGAEDWNEVHGRIEEFFKDKEKTLEQARLLEVMHEYKVARNIAKDEEAERRFWLQGQEALFSVLAIACVALTREFLIKVNRSEDPFFVLMLLVFIVGSTLMDGVLIYDSKEKLRNETSAKTNAKKLGQNLCALTIGYKLPNANKFSLSLLVTALEMQEKKRKGQQLVEEVMAEEALRKQSRNTDHLKLDEVGSAASEPTFEDIQASDQSQD